MKQENLDKKEEWFLEDIATDYVALGGLVRLCLEGKKILPTEEEFIEALEFLGYLLTKYGDRLKYYIGPGVELINKNPNELVAWLKEMWQAGKYEEIEYGVWFAMD